ncbi:MAG: phytanoyl-CoA dioxygenase family protein [bacterium]|nr:phytanoyl-CoA dioxygenase family protein [bacterium]
MESSAYLEDNYGPDGYDPGLYQATAAAESVLGFDGVTEAHLAQFHKQGFLAVERAYDTETVARATAAVTRLISGASEEFKGVQFEKGIRDRADRVEGEDREILVRKLTRFVGFDPELDVIGEDPKLLNILSKIMGESPRLFANQAMLKPPGIGREKPWHQDHAYFNLPLDTCIVSAWVALDRADPENGCMHVIPGSHLEGPVVHFNRRDWQICDTDIARSRIVSVALEPGGLLLWHGRLHHGTPANRSDRRRRALQLHYVPDSAQTTDPADRLAAFGNDGKDVAC